MKMRRYTTVLSVISCLAVVLLHANSCFWTFSYDQYWLSANVIECVCYFAVPVFFMISGCNLLDYRDRYSTKIYFEKRIKKSVIPFLLWSVIGTLYQLRKGVMSINEITVNGYISDVFNSQINAVYWFFIPLFAAYLCIPVLSLIPKKDRKDAGSYMLACGFILIAVLPLICRITGIQWNGSFGFPVLGGYLFYIVAGYYIDRYEIRKSTRYLIYIMGIVGLLMHIIGTWKLSYANNAITDTFKGYLNLPCVLTSIAVFVLFKYLEDAPIMDWLHKIAKVISPTTLGVYLIHWYLLDIFAYVSKIPVISMKYRLGGGFLIFLVSVCIVGIMRKIPVVKYLVP